MAAEAIAAPQPQSTSDARSGATQHSDGRDGIRTHCSRTSRNLGLGYADCAGGGRSWVHH